MAGHPFETADEELAAFRKALMGQRQLHQIAMGFELEGRERGNFASCRCPTR